MSRNDTIIFQTQQDLTIPEFRYRQRRSTGLPLKALMSFTSRSKMEFWQTKANMYSIRQSRQFGVIDYNTSLATWFSTRRSQGSSINSIRPRASIVEDQSKGDIGKTVHFGYVTAIEKSFESFLLQSDREQIGERLTHDEVTRGLEEKLGYEIADSQTSFERAISGFGQATTPISSLEKSSLGDEDSLQGDDKQKASFKGVLLAAGGSRLSAIHHRKPEAKLNKYNLQSRRATMYENESYLLNETWPWPWLDRKANALDIFATTSEVPVTYSRQGELMKLKIPLLASSLKRYLESIEPHLPPSHLSVTKSAAKDFAIGDGSKFQDVLLEKEKDSTNWHKTALPNYTFLLSRNEQCLQNIPIVLPFFDDLWPANDGSQIKRAAVLITFSLQFWSLLRKEQLNPCLNENNEVVCMHSFRKLFSACRIPGIPVDGVSTVFKNDRESGKSPKHIIVTYKGFIFSMDVVDQNMAILSEDIIKCKLEGILDVVKQGSVEDSQGVGALTSANRNMWCVARETLISLSTRNQANLQLIEEALFLVGLDHCNASASKLGQEAVFGDACNRWYDKSLSFYIYANGLITANVNRSLEGGMAAALLIKYIHESILENTEKWDDDLAVSAFILSSMNQRKHDGYPDIFDKTKHSSSTISDLVISNEQGLGEWSTESSEHGLHLLEFDLDDEIKDDIEQSIMIFQTLQTSLSTADCTYLCFANDIVEENGINADALAHLIMQLTFFRMYYRLASIGTRIRLERLYHGRTDVIMSSTVETLQWCKVMLSPDSNKDEKVQAFWTAEKKHRAIYEQVAGGRGCVNHLTALKIIAKEMRDDSVQFFEGTMDPFPGGMERFDIFAETLGSNFVSRSVALPNHTGGYGVGYSIHKSKICFYVSSWNDEPTTSAELYASSLRRTLELNHEFFDLSLKK